MRPLIIAALLIAPAAHAQDNIKWETPLGRVEYVLEDGQFAVLQYELPFGDNIGRFYIDGLAGEFGGNGPLDGYWSEPDISHDDEDDNTLICPFAITDGEGRTTRNWGRIRIAFLDTDFPGDFILMRGRCFEDPADVIPGKLIR
jgi:hypothetical protein